MDANREFEGTPQHPQKSRLFGAFRARWEPDSRPQNAPYICSMSEQESTPSVEKQADESRISLKTGMLRCLLFVALISPTMVIQAYLFKNSDPVRDTESEIEDRVTYLTGKQNLNQKLIEVDLGEFNISVVRSEIKKVLRIRFQLTGLVVEGDVDRFETYYEQNMHRVRDRIIDKLTKTEAKHLVDPRLSTLRLQLIDMTNDMAGSPLFRNIVFSNYTIVQQ